jgi:hypothetical protein
VGLIQWLEREKLKKKKTSETLHVSAVPPGASNLLIITCKHKSIHQLLGLIQWLKNEEKKLQKKSTQAKPSPADCSAQGLQIYSQ